MKILTLIFFLSVYSFPQQSFLNRVDTAYLFAKKGIFWALENINFKKERLSNKLLTADKLIADVKIEKHVNGFQIESTGYFDSYSVKISVFRNSEKLQEEGYYKPDSLLQNNNQISVKKKKRN